MGFLSTVPILGNIIEGGLNIIDKFVEDKDQANQLKAEIKKQIENQAHKEKSALIQEQGKIISAEVKGDSWLQRNWRPLIMMIFALILANNYILFPYLAMFTEHVTVLDFPGPFWGLLTTGIGGYIGAKSIERIKKVRPEQKN